MKKQIMFLFLLLVIFCLCSCTHLKKGQDPNANNDKEYKYPILFEESIGEDEFRYPIKFVPDDEKFETFFAEEDILDAWGNFTQEEQADYAGVYIDDDTVVLLFKEGSNSLKNAITRNSRNANMLVNQDKKLQQSLVIESATYTYNDLMAVYDLLVEKAYSLEGVCSVSLSNKGNCIDVGIASTGRTSEIQKQLLTMVQAGTGVKNVEEDPVLSFHIVSEEDEFSY